MRTPKGQAHLPQGHVDQRTTAGASQPLAVPTSARPPLADDRAWGVEDVAYFLNVSESLVRKLEREGQLPALPRIGRRLNFDSAVVRAFRSGTLNTAPLRVRSSR